MTAPSHLRSTNEASNAHTEHDQRRRCKPTGRSGNAAEHLWMHFTRMSSYATKPVPTIERGEGAYIWDINARHRVAAEGVAVREGGIATTAHRRRWPAMRNLLGNVLRHENSFRQTLERLYDLPIVGDVRGDGYFYAVELVKDKATKETLNADDVERVLRGYVAGALYENGLYCRTDDRGNAVVQVAPPLICGQAEFDEMEQIMRHVLTEAWARI
jgi:adenosylmethionine-8-amino-7-oxononanoate aminotransferase